MWDRDGDRLHDRRSDAHYPADWSILTRVDRLSEVYPFDTRLSDTERQNALARLSLIALLLFAVLPLSTRSKGLGAAGALALGAISAIDPSSSTARQLVRVANSGLAPAVGACAADDASFNRRAYDDAKPVCAYDAEAIDAHLTRSFPERADAPRSAFERWIQVPDHIEGY